MIWQAGIIECLQGFFDRPKHQSFILCFANKRKRKGVVTLSAPMGQNGQNIQCHCEPVTDVTGVAIPRIGVKFKIS